MSSWSAELRRSEAARRTRDREAKKRQNELDRLLKERETFSALEQARLEVEEYENALELLLSVHEEESEPVDWSALASALPPYEPPRLARHELAAMLRSATGSSSQVMEDIAFLVDSARAVDDHDHEEAIATYRKNLSQWERLHSLALGVLAGEPQAYTGAISEFSTFTEISNLGSSIHVTVHHAKLIECELTANGRDIIPTEAKSLTAKGKLAVKALPPAHANELYQDHVCSCVLRLARELLALLPIETALITATVSGIDSRTGHLADLPVLSLAAPRRVIEQLNYERLDPSDAIANFQHRGDVIASRRSSQLAPISPLTPTDIVAETRPEMMDFTLLRTHVRELLAELTQSQEPPMPEIPLPVEAFVTAT